MKILVASDSYKGCMSSKQANAQIIKGINRLNANHECIAFPIGDGGEGTMQAFHDLCYGHKVSCVVKDAYFQDIKVEYTLIDNGKTAVFDVASVIGLNSYERSARRPLYATSYGIGQLIKDALKHQVNKIIIGLGGSCTNDGGMGLLNALGVRFYDKNHRYLKTSAISLSKIAHIDFNPMVDLDGVEIIAACDVNNYLLGKEGATYAFGKQKGLNQEQKKQVEKGMENYVNKMRYKGYELTNIIGGGAAGGIGAVLIGVLKAQFKSSLTLLFEYKNIDKLLKDCDLVITGEGQSDYQTAFGKAPIGILRKAQEHNIPCICISGALGVDYMKLYDEGFVGLFSIADRAMSFMQALKDAPIKLMATSYNVIKTISYFRGEKS